MDSKELLEKIHDRLKDRTGLGFEDILADIEEALHSLQQAGPVAYAVFTGGDNIRIWSANMKDTLRAEFGDSLMPLYTGPGVKESLTVQTLQPVKGLNLPAED